MEHPQHVLGRCKSTSLCIPDLELESWDGLLASHQQPLWGTMKLKLEIYCDGFLSDLGAWRDSAVVVALQVCSLGDCLVTGEHNPSQEQGWVACSLNKCTLGVYHVQGSDQTERWVHQGLLPVILLFSLSVNTTQARGPQETLGEHLLKRHTAQNWEWEHFNRLKARANRFTYKLKKKKLGECRQGLA